MATPAWVNTRCSEDFDHMREAEVNSIRRSRFESGGRHIGLRHW